MNPRSVWSWWISILLLAAMPGFADPADPGSKYADRSLTEALLDLEAAGLKLVFTSQVVRPELLVTAEPTSGSLRGILDELLAAHGLRTEAGPGGTLVVVPADPAETAIRGTVRDLYSGRPLAFVQILIPGTALDAMTAEDGSFAITGLEPGTYSVEARRPGFVVEPLSGVTVAAGRVTEVAFELVASPVPLDEIVVTPSLISLLRADPVATFGLTSEEISALPHLGDDLFRALTLLPGTSATEFSAQFHIRGGRTDEVLVMLDQLELFDPYHIKDFSSALSIIAPYAIDKVELSLGGFPAPFGDRMAGVLDMTTVQPDQGRRHAGLSILSVQLGGSGLFDDERGNWLGVARVGSLKLVESYVSSEVQPEYGDAFVKIEHAVGSGGSLGIRVLHAEDRLDTLIIEDGDIEETNTSYGNTYLWITHRALLTSKLYVDSVASGGRIDRVRFAEQTKEGEFEFLIDDRRDLDIGAFKQGWNYQPSDRQYLRWGLDVRRLDSHYDYVNEDVIDPLLEALEGPSGEDGEVTFFERIRGEQAGAYFSDRLRLSDAVTAELGVRYDEHTVTKDRDLSPRFNLVAAVGKSTTLRAAWGHYFQSQRIYELLVEDGETDFFPSERTEQFALGLDHLFRGGSLRIDLYHRDVTAPRPRYENLYEPADSFPEVQADRVRIAPQRSTARGVECSLRGAWKKLDWWFNYAYATVEDQLEGRDVPRGFDQPHTFNASLAYRIHPNWTLNLAFRYHTGWPTTAVGGRLE
ncbi:MAG: TonB-dependent receptor, partial [Thermoanaerobaculia bacterium]